MNNDAILLIFAVIVVTLLTVMKLTEVAAKLDTLSAQADRILAAVKDRELPADAEASLNTLSEKLTAVETEVAGG